MPRLEKRLNVSFLLLFHSSSVIPNLPQGVSSGLPLSSLALARAVASCSIPSAAAFSSGLIPENAGSGGAIMFTGSVADICNIVSITSDSCVGVAGMPGVYFNK